MSCLCQLPDECIARNSELQDLSSCQLCFFTLPIALPLALSTIGASNIPRFCLNAPTAGGRALFYRLHLAIDRIRKL